MSTILDPDMARESLGWPALIDSRSGLRDGGAPVADKVIARPSPTPPRPAPGIDPRIRQVQPRRRLIRPHWLLMGFVFGLVIASHGLLLPLVLVWWLIARRSRRHSKSR